MAGRRLPARNPKTEDMLERRKLLAELRKRTKAGEISRVYLSGAMYMDNSQIRKVLRGERNPIAESILAGLGLGIGYGIASRIIKKKNPKPRRKTSRK